VRIVNEVSEARSVRHIEPDGSTSHKPRVGRDSLQRKQPPHKLDRKSGIFDYGVMRHISIAYLVLALLGLSFLHSYDVSEALPIEQSTFPDDFESGILGAGVDCEHIDFLPNGQFAYKFTGDCKGWGRVLKGQWRKEGKYIVFAATLRENASEGKTGCAGSYYHKNTPSEVTACFEKYKQGILESFGVFPAVFDLSGKLWVGLKGKIAVSIESYLTNNPKKGKIKGLMHFTDEEFGTFYRKR